ncbi:MAG TPA: copper homeostasis membrane protein CopD, partial [Polyangiaceae bacterium]
MLFGGLAFAFGVATPAWRRAEPVASGADHGVNRWCLRVARWSVLASIASGIAWLVAEAAAMSGMPVGEALNRRTLALVLATQFGRVWTLRLGLVIALGVLLFVLGRSTIDKQRPRLAIAALVVAAAYLATLAWSGHAAAGEGSDRLPQLGSDVVHLLAAGAWLGALPGLVFVLGSAQPLDALARTTRRFSALGVASVSALVLSGFVNAWYLVGDVPALFGTEYGRLLLAKLALFAAMVVLAVVNRWYLTPRLAGDDRPALDSLRRNAILETAAGIVVVMIVGALGVTVPAAHQPTLWPFDHTLSWRPAQQSGWVGAIVAAAGTLACVAVGVTLEGARRRRPLLWIAGLAGIMTTAATSAWLLAVPS